MRKRVDNKALEKKMEKIEEENKTLIMENATLRAEKKLLSDQLSYFQALVGNMSTKQSSTISSSNDQSIEKASEIDVESNFP
jgi:regulator of replication initiation timing